MIPETENPQEAKSVYPGTCMPAQHAKADPDRYVTHVLAGRLIMISP